MCWGRPQKFTRESEKQYDNTTISRVPNKAMDSTTKMKIWNKILNYFDKIT
jgi:hypothetical protein